MRNCLFVLVFTGIAATSFYGIGCKAGVETHAAVAEPVKPEPAVAPPAPPADRDKDGVPDADDACPDVAGNPAGAKKGCPDEPPALATVVGSDIKIKDKILFAVGKATLDPSADPIIAVVAKILVDMKDVELVEIEGHADHVGDPISNLRLTDARAKAVVDALVKRGVDAKRLVARGYGEYCPIEAGESEAARDANRRVAFKILKVGGKKTDGHAGCDAAMKAGVKPIVY